MAMNSSQISSPCFGGTREGRINGTALSPDLLPPIDQERKGWPWTEGSVAPCVSGPLPLISVVIPSYNQGVYLEETIRSILLQAYPATEIFIIDGGSTDNSLEIITKYSAYLSGWISEPDDGQTAAINRGFRMTSGEWVAWQNSDDSYKPNAFWNLYDSIRLKGDTDVFYGITQLTNHSNVCGSLASVHMDFEIHDMVPLPFVFNQSAFFSRRILDNGVYLDTRMRHLMDYEYIWRLVLSGFRFRFAPGVGGNFRQQPLSKTASPYHSAIGCREFMELYQGLYTNGKFPLHLRHRIRDGMNGQIANAWANRRYDDIRENLAMLFRTSGARKLNVEVVGLFIASILPSATRECLRYLFRSYRHDAILETSSPA